MARALVTGVTGQDGRYLAEALLARGHEVHGLVRRTPPAGWLPTAVIQHPGDLTDAAGLAMVVRKVSPDLVFHLGAQSHVRLSFDLPLATADVGFLGTVRLLEALRALDRPVRFYQASSSEMFGATGAGVPRDEESPFAPRSPYAIAKVAAHHAIRNAREAWGLHACGGILFNHESPRRGEGFVTRKITLAIAAIVAGRQSRIALGNLEARRDWGYAGDYVDAMIRILDHDVPDDYVIATGRSRSVRDLLSVAATLVDLDPPVDHDPALLRPTEVPDLVGDARKAARVLGWTPTTPFEGWVARMVAGDLWAAGLDPARFPALSDHLPADFDPAHPR